MTYTLLTRRFIRAAGAGMIALGMMTVSGCSGLFDVEDPQAFGDADLNNEDIIANVAAGAEGALHQSFDDLVVMTSLLGDEMESTSTWIDWEDISEGRLRADWATAGAFSGFQNNLLRARFAAQSAATRIETVLGSAATTSPLLTQVKWVDGVADLLFGMSVCEGPLVSDGPRSPNTAFFTQAITKLSATLSLANGLGASDRNAWVPAILAARARANLFAGNYDAAIADASAVPDGYVKNAVFAGGSGAQQSWTGHQFHQNRNRSGGLRRMYHSHVLGTFNPNTYTTGHLYDWFDNTKPDPRMAVTRKEGELGVNNRFDYYGITKYNDYAADIPMFKKAEMNLIEAEAYFRKNDFATMTQKLNINRTAAGLAPIPVPGTAAEAQNAVLNERMAVLFVEGQRAYDLARYDLVTQILGPGRAEMIPLSRNEILDNNAMVDGEGTCPSIS